MAEQIPKNKLTLTVTNRTVVRVLVLIFLSIFAWGAFRHAAHALLILFTALFLAIALNAPVHWLAEKIPGKRRGSRAIATAASFLVVILLLGGFLASIVPPLVRQTSSFIQAAPHLVEEVRDQNSSIGKVVRKYRLEDEVNKFSTQLSERLKNVGGTAVSGVTKVGSSVFTVLTVLVLTFMMLVEGPRWGKLFSDLLPAVHQDRAHRLAHDMYKVVRGYVNGQVLLAALASLLILPAVLLLHISYPAALVVVIFICGLIPLVGHTIGAIIVTTVALFHSPLAAVVILAYYILYQQIENYVIQPRLQANTTNMSPLLVFTAVVIGVSFGGLFGGLVAIPVMGCVRVAAIDYLRSIRKLEAVNDAEAASSGPASAKHK